MTDRERRLTEALEAMVQTAIRLGLTRGEEGDVGWMDALMAHFAAIKQSQELLGEGTARPSESDSWKHQEDSLLGNTASGKPNDPPSTPKDCPRCGIEDAHQIIDGRCWDCRIAEEEAGWVDEDEDEGGAPWGR